MEKKGQDNTVEERTLFDTLGDELHRERQKKGIDIETVSKALNIRPSFVEALEKNEYGVFPAEVYGIAFLRSYGNYLGLDGDKVVRQYKEQIAQKEGDGNLPIKAEKAVLPQKTIVIIAIILILIVLAFSLFIGMNEKISFSASQPKMTAPAIEINPNKQIVTAFIETEVSVSDKKDILSDKVDEIRETTLTLEDEIKSKFPEIKGVTYGTVDINAPLVLIAKDRVWIDVKEKNDIIFDKVLMQGDAYFVPQSENDLIMRTGNARALFVYVNGMPQGELSKKETVKNNILLKPETFEKK